MTDIIIGAWTYSFSISKASNFYQLNTGIVLDVARAHIPMYDLFSMQESECSQNLKYNDFNDLWVQEFIGAGYVV